MAKENARRLGDTTFCCKPEKNLLPFSLYIEIEKEAIHMIDSTVSTIAMGIGLASGLASLIKIGLDALKHRDNKALQIKIESLEKQLSEISKEIKETRETIREVKEKEISIQEKRLQIEEEKAKPQYNISF